MGGALASSRMDWKSIVLMLLCFSGSEAFSLLSSSRMDKVFPQFQKQTGYLSKQRTTPLYSTTFNEGLKKKSIYVVGSVNADIIVNIPRLPSSGETLLGSGGQVLPGGKGANQAVAAGRLKSRFPGLDVKFCGVFGSDVHAPMLKSTMESSNVDLKYSFDSNGPTGQAMILLQPDGENSIVLIPGANHDWPSNWKAKALPGISQASCVMLQREIPDSINIAVAAEAKKNGIPVLLDLGGDETPPPDEVCVWKCVFCITS